MIPPVSGNAGKVLTVNPTGTGTLWAPAGVRSVTEYLTSGTSWVAPATLVGGRVQYEMVGGGSSGAGTTTGHGRMGAFGGYCRGLATVTPGGAYAYSVGAGGAARAGGVSAAGAAGGNTTMFGATANGASAPAAGAPANGAATAGGAATGADINLAGASAFATASNAQVHVGATPLGSGTWCFDIQRGQAPTGYGYGGRGSLGNAGTPSDAGGNGVIVLTYLVSI